MERKEHIVRNWSGELSSIKVGRIESRKVYREQDGVKAD